MFTRISLTTLVFAAILLLWGNARFAYADKSHDGKVVSVTEGSAEKDGKLTMTDKDGKNEHSHAIASTVKVTLNGKSAKLGDLKKGDAITVKTGDAGKVLEIMAKR